jgi:micrococcal nuclease
MKIFLVAALLGLSALPAQGGEGFPLCGGGRRVNCVVDGDTFWIDGVKVRIAGIDAPEVSSPRCASERALGDEATLRLASLLNAGAFDLGPGPQDEDRYGRKLRIVTREGVSIGDQLVAEGLARRWDGARRSWCD